MNILPPVKFASIAVGLPFCALLCACPRATPPAPKSTSLPAIAITVQDKLLYTFFDPAAGKFSSVTDAEEVLATQRSWVRVLRLATKADARPEHELVYVVDLEKAGNDGKLPYIVVSRRAFEIAGQNRGARPGQMGAAPTGTVGQHDQVILYGTAWCSACRSAAAYLTKKGIPFINKDIEKDQAAASELMRKTQAAGISSSGVPVIDVRGKLIQGFDPDTLNRLLGGSP